MFQDSTSNVRPVLPCCRLSSQYLLCKGAYLDLQMEVVTVPLVKELNLCKLGVFAICKILFSSLHFWTSRDFL